MLLWLRDLFYLIIDRANDRSKVAEDYEGVDPFYRDKDDIGSLEHLRKIKEDKTIKRPRSPRAKKS